MEVCFAIRNVRAQFIEWARCSRRAISGPFPERNTERCVPLLPTGQPRKWANRGKEQLTPVSFSQVRNSGAQPACKHAQPAPHNQSEIANSQQRSIKNHCSCTGYNMLWSAHFVPPTRVCYSICWWWKRQRVLCVRKYSRSITRTILSFCALNLHCAHMYVLAIRCECDNVKRHAASSKWTKSGFSFRSF